MTAILTVQNLDKAFGTREVLRGVSFAVMERDRVGLVGVNGSGKTTLLRLLCGDPSSSQAPDAGLITRRRGLRVAHVEQEPILPGAVTVREALRGGLSAGTEDHDYEIRELAAAFRLRSLEAEVGSLSFGELRRVAIARALLGRPELLALDEPTNHLDARMVEWLEERLRSVEGALLLVTHDRYFLDRVATRILELDRGRLFAYPGSYSRFLELQAERLEVETAHERARLAFVRRELEWIRRGPSARGTKQRARVERFEAAVEARPSAAPTGPLALRLPSGGRLGKTVLEVRGLARALGGKQLFANLDLVLKPGDRIGIVGENGAGKTTLLRTIVGLAPPDAGEIVIGQNTRMAYLDQERAELHDDRTVLQEVAGDSDHVFLEEGVVHVRTFLRRMLFDDGFADTPVSALSGGERNRVQLAKLLRRGGNLLVLDEPTNDLDLPTLEVLEEALAAFPGCALVVSHDRFFLDRIATAILAFEGEGRLSRYEGSYSSYIAHRPDPRPSPAKVPAAAPSPARRRPPAPRRLTYKERLELAQIEENIAKAEAGVAALEAVLGDPRTYKERSAEVRDLVAELDALRLEVTRLYDRWQELDAVPG